MCPHLGVSEALKGAIFALLLIDSIKDSFWSAHGGVEPGKKGKEQNPYQNKMNKVGYSLFLHCKLFIVWENQQAPSIHLQRVSIPHN